MERDRLLLICGVVLSSSRNRKGFVRKLFCSKRGLIAVGFLIVSIAFFWLAPVMLPLVLIISLFFLVGPSFKKLFMESQLVQNIVCIPILIGFAVGLTGATYIVITNFIDANNAATRPSVIGKILRSEVIETQPGFQWSPEIEYQYEVNGKQYKSHEIQARGSHSKSQSTVERLVNEFPVNKAVPVYYDPKKPSDSYLKVGVDMEYFVDFIGPAVVIGLLAKDGINCLIEKRYRMTSTRSK